VNLALGLLYAAERNPGAEALVGEGSRLTYAGLRERAARIAAGLADRGVGPGDRVACVLANDPETVELYWACQWLGAVFVPLSFRVAKDDLDYCIADCGAAVVVREPAEVRELVAADEHPGALDLEDAAPSIQLYTSGTTGRPKGVPRSHAAERASALSQVVQHGLEPGHRTLGVMPLYHTMGVHSMLAAAAVGGCFVTQPTWEAEAALELVARERITALYLAPTLFYDLVHHPRLADADTSSVRAIAYAGAPMTSALVEKVADTFAPEIFVNHYGSTEIYTFSVQRDQRAKPGCAGRAALNARIRLDPPDEGEVLCHMSSDEAFAGYWNRPDADEKAIRDGWYHTGDVGRLDEDGDLWVVGAAGDAPRSMWEADLSGGLALVFGAEGKGLRPLVRRTCDELVGFHAAMFRQVVRGVGEHVCLANEHTGQIGVGDMRVLAGLRFAERTPVIHNLVISNVPGPPSSSAAPRTIWERITPEFPRAFISAARVVSWASAPRFSAIEASSASSIPWTVSARFVPVSPSGTG